MSTQSEQRPQAVPVPSGTVVKGAPLPQVNLLPPEIGAAKAFRTVQVGLGVGLLAVVGVVGLLYVQATGSVSDAQSQLDQATSQSAVAQKQVASYDNVTAVYAAVDAKEAMLTKAMGHEVLWSNQLVNLSLAMPDSSWITSLTVAQDVDGTSAPVTGPAPADPPVATLTFAGDALSYPDVAVWLESLANQPAVAQPYFSSSTETYVGSKKVIELSSTAVVTSEAYSGRYTQPGGGAR